MNFWAMSPRESESAAMMDAKSEALVHSVHELLAEKRVVGKKERELVQALNSALRKMGYKVVSIHSARLAARQNSRGRPRKRRGPGRPRKVGRPRGR
jgi:superfamily II DNA/RNA helicase